MYIVPIHPSSLPSESTPNYTFPISHPQSVLLICLFILSLTYYSCTSCSCILFTFVLLFHSNLPPPIILPISGTCMIGGKGQVFITCTVYMYMYLSILFTFFLTNVHCTPIPIQSPTPNQYSTIYSVFLSLTYCTYTMYKSYYTV